MAAAHVVTALQAIAARETDPLSSAVVSVTMFHAGDAYNVIPQGARIGGTLRSLSTEGLQSLRDRVDAVVHATALAHRCNASIAWSADAYPPTMNDPELWKWATEIAAPASTENEVRVIDPTMGGEDFAFYAQEIPSVFLALGPAPSPSLRSPVWNLTRRSRSTTAASCCTRTCCGAASRCTRIWRCPIWIGPPRRKA